MSEELILAIAGLLHNTWGSAMNNLMLVKKEENDGSPDWESFHAARLESCQIEEYRWNRFKTEFQEAHRDVLKKAWGI